MFEWIWNPESNIHFVVIETFGVHLYMIDEEKFIMKETLFIPNDTPLAWFEVEILHYFITNNE